MQHDQVHKKNWHDKYYKAMLLIPLALLIFSFVYLGLFYSQNGDFFRKDITLTGGTSVTIQDETLDSDTLEQALSEQLEKVNIREIYDVTTQERKALIIQTTSDAQLTKSILEEVLGYELTEENSSLEFTGSSLGQSFYRQLVIAVLVAFVFMAIVVFIIFRKSVPSLAVVISAFADITMTLVAVNLLGMEMSSAGIVAILMLIGYSVDTDILLTTRVLKRTEGTLNQRLFGAFKTGTTMTLTSIFAVGFALIFVQSFSIVLSQILTILLIGLLFDLLNTWITNVSLLKWYVLKRK